MERRIVHRNKFVVYFSVADVPRELGDAIKVNGYHVYLTRRKLHYGERRLFICPSCGSVRGKLILCKDGVCCRGCAPFDIYEDRRNLYDEGGTELIKWHMRKIAASIGIELTFPFDYYEYLSLNPIKKNAREKLRKGIYRLQVLENMRIKAIFEGEQYSGNDIKNGFVLADTELFNLRELHEYRYAPYGCRNDREEIKGCENETAN